MRMKDYYLIILVVCTIIISLPFYLERKNLIFINLKILYSRYII